MLELNFVGLDPATRDASETYVLEDAELPLMVFGPLGFVSRGVVVDGRYVPGGSDTLTSRHNKRADVGFADGHVENVKWQFGDNLNNTDPNRP